CLSSPLTLALPPLTLFPYTTLFRSLLHLGASAHRSRDPRERRRAGRRGHRDRIGPPSVAPLRRRRWPLGAPRPRLVLPFRLLAGAGAVRFRHRGVGRRVAQPATPSSAASLLVVRRIDGPGLIGALVTRGRGT